MNSTVGAVKLAKFMRKACLQKTPMVAGICKWLNEVCFSRWRLHDRLNEDALMRIRFQEEAAWLRLTDLLVAL
jgi:hypothetical protein